MNIKPVKRNSWLYCLPNNVTFETDLIGAELNTKFVTIEKNGKVTIRKGYAWNGNTPKCNILDLWLVGTPEGNVNQSTGKPNTYYASCLHDALYQYSKHLKQCGISRKQVDREYKKYLGEHRAAGLYYLGVRTFGWAYWA